MHVKIILLYLINTPYFYGVAKKHDTRYGPIATIGVNKIVQYLSEGYTYRYIATVEKQHKRSIEDAIDNLRKKHGCQNVCELVGVFIKQGFIDGPEIKSANTYP